ncbi:MAG: hypothetical protein K6E10_10835 [Eubacterium sp.]|nr:hypothetical protein [Eubacterium sp.]
MSKKNKEKNSKKQNRPKRIKREKNPLDMEAKKVLLNQVEIDKDGHYKTVDEFRFAYWGSGDGENRVRFFGVSRKDVFYQSEQNMKKVLDKAGKAMGNIGRGINLKSRDDAVACIVKTYIFYPVVLIFRKEEENLQLTGYTARTFSAPIALSVAIRLFNKALDDSVEKIENKEGILERIRESRLRRKAEKEKRRDFLKSEIEESEIEESEIEESGIKESEIEESEEYIEASDIEENIEDDYSEDTYK